MYVWVAKIVALQSTENGSTLIIANISWDIHKDERTLPLTRYKYIEAHLTILDK